MKVVVVLGSSKDEKGGETRVGVEFAENLSKKVETGFIYLSDNNEVKSVGNLCHCRIERMFFNGISLPLLTTKNIKFLFLFLDSYKPDIIHLQTFSYISIIVQEWARRNSVPVVCTAHLSPVNSLSWIDLDRSKFIIKLLNYFAKIYFKFLLDGCLGVVALNGTVEQALTQMKYKGFIFQINNGRNLELFTKLDTSSNFHRDKIFLIYIGSILRRKNQFLLVQMMKHLSSNFELILVGSKTNHSYVKQIERYIEKTNLKNITFVGSVDYLQIPLFLEKSDIFVSASKVEVQSLAVIEALAAGKPVIGISNETIDELITDRNGKILSVNVNAQEFAEAIKAFVALSSSNKKEIISNCRKSVVEFDWKNVVDETLEAYASVLNQFQVATFQKETIDEISVSFRIKRDFKIFNSKLLRSIISGLMPILKKFAKIDRKNISLK